MAEASTCSMARGQNDIEECALLGVAVKRKLKYYKQSANPDVEWLLRSPSPGQSQ